MSSKSIQKITYQLPVECFRGAKTGVEKESLRVKPDGRISQAEHPQILGSSLTHPCITTDFSEALIELITPPCTHSSEVIDFLTDTETFVHQQLPSEYLWSSSMPCFLNSESDIPIAQYGSSQLGQMKTIYRKGLAHRYGKNMQVIAGMHFNFSFSSNLWKQLHQTHKQERKKQDVLTLNAYINTHYMGVIRNMQRFGWLNLYLFGASPSICKSFTEPHNHNLQELDNESYYLPYATSLRMSDIGYTNKRNNHSLRVCYDSIDSYAHTLAEIMNKPHPEYASINDYGDDQAQQLNSNVLQIENEYYTTVRPKQIPQPEESHFEALQSRGIRYVELRSLDINPFHPNGLNQSQLQFLEIYMHYCLFKDSPIIDNKEAVEIETNQNIVARLGRQDGLKISRNYKNIKMQQWAEEIFKEMLPIANSLDEAYQTVRYSRSLNEYLQMVENPELTPSARILSDMQANNECFTEFAMRKSKQHHTYYQSINLPEEKLNYYNALSRKSLRQQLMMEKVDNESNDERIYNTVPA